MIVSLPFLSGQVSPNTNSTCDGGYEEEEWESAFVVLYMIMITCVCLVRCSLATMYSTARGSGRMSQQDMSR